MVSFLEAQELVLARARSFGTEDLALSLAFGRVLMGPVFADRDYPPFPRAMMDGYALRCADLLRGVRRFRVTETLFAGMQAGSGIGAGECFKIMTGAAVPRDADIVIRREEVEEGGGEGREVAEGGGRERGVEVKVKGQETWRPFMNIARQGEDLRSGEIVLEKPCRISPAVMGLLATVGMAEVAVAKLPRVALVTTGDEVVEPGGPVGPVQIRNSNRYLLSGAFSREGISLTGGDHASDDPEALMSCLKKFLDYDILVVTGGVSAGDADHVPGVLTELGVRPLFHKMAIRPGKPTFCGVLPTGGMVFALPGNPFSCLVNFVLLIAPYLHACWGLELSLPVSLPLREARGKRVSLDEFFPVRVEGRPAMLTQMPLNSSGDIRLAMQANALALHPAGMGEMAGGTEVVCYSFV